MPTLLVGKNRLSRPGMTFETVGGARAGLTNTERRCRQVAVARTPFPIVAKRRLLSSRTVRYRVSTVGGCVCAGSRMALAARSGGPTPAVPRTPPIHTSSRCNPQAAVELPVEEMSTVVRRLSTSASDSSYQPAVAQT